MALQPLEKLPESDLEIKRALLSVSDKTGIVSLARKLAEAGVEILSTGGTAGRLAGEGIPVTDVADITGYPECLDGRVKTLHPALHAGILARTSYAPDLGELDELDIQPIELVVCNLYPFAQTASDSESTLEKATEYIDIGGPTMIRAAAKNFAHVCVLTNPGLYEHFIEEFSDRNGISFDTRKEWARLAFNHTAAYDVQIANYFNQLFDESNPPQLNISLPKASDLRYGENPHQQAAVYGQQDDYIECFHGKQLSYNNYLDLDAVLELITDFEQDDPTCAIFKHTVPCGVATGNSLREAWEKAFATDTSSPFGGIVAVNRPLDLETAQAIDQIFTEIIAAPSFSENAIDLLKKKKNRRLVRVKQMLSYKPERSYRSIFGGALSQDPDAMKTSFEQFEVVTNRKPTEDEVRDLHFAWKVVKHVKSNAIVYARNRQTIGIGTGQTSRVESSKIAIQKAREEGLSTENTVIASDAFFPFPDGVEAAAKAGARAVIQPGGSIRDDEVIKMADSFDMAMVCTGTRHFRH